VGNNTTSVAKMRAQLFDHVGCKRVYTTALLWHHRGQSPPMTGDNLYPISLESALSEPHTVRHIYIFARAASDKMAGLCNYYNCSVGYSNEHKSLHKLHKGDAFIYYGNMPKNLAKFVCNNIHSNFIHIAQLKQHKLTNVLYNVAQQKKKKNTSIMLVWIIFHRSALHKRVSSTLDLHKSCF